MNVIFSIYLRHKGELTQKWILDLGSLFFGVGGEIVYSLLENQKYRKTHVGVPKCLISGTCTYQVHLSVKVIYIYIYIHV